MQSIQQQLGKRIRQLREKKGWSQEQMADIAGFHRSYAGALERGEKNLTVSSLHTIAKTLNTTISELFRGIA